MRRSELTEDDHRLIEVASDLLNRSWRDREHCVACAVRMVDGTIFAGLHIGGRRIDVCAEQITIGMAVSNGQRDFHTAVSVIKMREGDTPTVTSPCGVCREVLTWYGPEMNVIVLHDGSVMKTIAQDLLPAAWIPPGEPPRTDNPPADQPRP